MLRPEWLTKTFAQSVKKAKLPPLHLRGLRHTHATSRAEIIWMSRLKRTFRGPMSLPHGQQSAPPVSAGNEMVEPSPSSHGRGSAQLVGW